MPLLSRLRRARTGPGRGARVAATVLTAVLVSAAATAALPAAPAAADDGGVSLFGGTDLGLGAGTYGIVGPDAVAGLLDTSYSLADLDPVTGAVTAADVTDTLTDSYAMSADLSDSTFMAIDAANLARQAQEQADARRRALAAAQSGGLRPGAVPAPYDQMITDAVARYCPALPASVLAAQLKAESNFNPSARSPVGAQGIAQFMPATWASYGVDGNGDGKRDVYDPADAIPAAAKYDCAVRAAVRNVPGDPTANMLAAYNAGPGAVLQYNGVPPYAETQNYVRTIMSSAASFAANDATAQTEVGPDGCPTRAPSNTLRDGAASIGIAKLCADSVAGARSGAAAIAIKYALSHLGAPYSQARRNDVGYYDCSSFVSRAYRSAGMSYSGNAPTTATIPTYSWARRISYSDARPGDLIMPFPGHVAMQLTHGYKTHTNMTGDVSKVDRTYSSAYWTGWVDPSRM